MLQDLLVTPTHVSRDEVSLSLSTSADKPVVALPYVRKASGLFTWASPIPYAVENPPSLCARSVARSSSMRAHA